MAALLQQCQANLTMNKKARLCAKARMKSVFSCPPFNRPHRSPTRRGLHPCSLAALGCPFHSGFHPTCQCLQWASVSLSPCLSQAIGQVVYLQPYAYDPSPSWAFSAVFGLTLGSMAVVFIGDRITDIKLGNGTSLLIFTNIVSYLPASASRTFVEASAEGNYGGEAGLLLCFLFLVFGIVYVQVRPPLWGHTWAGGLPGALTMVEIGRIRTGVLEQIPSDGCVLILGGTMQVLFNHLCVT